MDQEVFALRQQVYAAAATFHGAGAAYAIARRAGQPYAQALNAFVAAAAPYDVALEALEQYLMTGAPAVAQAGELARLQRFRELLREEVALLHQPGEA
jgi:hypothetical protein